MGRTVGRAVSLSWLRRHKEPPKLHLQATYYKVGTDVVKAAHAGGTSGEVSAYFLLVQGIADSAKSAL